MSRNDYIKIAKVMSEQEPMNVATEEHLLWWRIARDLADIMADENPDRKSVV